MNDLFALETLPRTKADALLGHRVRQLRMARGITQQGFADALSRNGARYHQRTIAKIESGTRPLALVELFRVSRALDLSVHDFLEPFMPSDDTTPATTIDEFEQLTRDAATELMTEHGVAFDPDDVVDDFAWQLGDQPREWTRKSGLHALVRYAVEIDRERRDADTSSTGSPAGGIIRVTASVSYDFDPADGVAATEQEAIDDVLELLSAGVSPGEYTITTSTDQES